MRRLLKFLPVLIFALVGCVTGPPKPENETGVFVKVDKAYDHVEGLDVSLTLENRTRNLLRVPRTGGVAIYIDESPAIPGQLEDPVDLKPGRKVKTKAYFRFLNQPRTYKQALIEIAPAKVFAKCSTAKFDKDVVQEESAPANRDLAYEVQPVSCDRPLKRVIRMGL